MNEPTSVVDKKKYRSVYLRKRQMLSSAAFDEKNYRLLYHFNEFIRNLEFQYVHSFLSIDKNREVNTWPLIELLKVVGSKIVVSKSSVVDNLLTHYEFENYSQLKENGWGIPEPIHGNVMEPKVIDAVLIPLIVFDRAGQRIGYGKGYYDRFLAECRSDCLKIGLSLSPPLDFIPLTESHDIPMDYCITPLGVYQFNE
jgi:5-formyltetrahydrofolate cyclo-ligase